MPEDAELRAENPKSGWGDLPPEIRDTMFMRVFRELSHAKDNDRLLVLITNGFLELMISTLVTATCKNANKIKDMAYATQIMILHEKGVLSGYRFRTLDVFRKLRNDAAHEAIFEMDMKKFAAVFNQPANEGGSGDPVNQVKDLHSLCIMLIVTLWTDHKDILVPVFMPPASAPEGRGPEGPA